MTSHTDILGLFPSQKDLLGGLEAERCKVSQSTVSMWKARNDIPSRYWPALVKLAHGKTLPDGSPVTLETFASSQRRVREAAS